MILAGDIGGTNARIAFFEVEQRRLKRIHEHVYPTHEHPNLESAVASFIGEYGVKPRVACFGIAGSVSGERRAEMPNLTWVIEVDKLAREIGIESVTLLNDLEANAYCIAALEPSNFASLNEGHAEASGNQGVIAAGTGLGEVGLYWDGKTHRPFASEGGHASFAPSDELQNEMLVYLRREFGHVSWERVVSGPGLFNIYRFLRDTGRGDEPAWLLDELAHRNPSVQITHLGLAGKSELCVRALEMFVSMYGTEAGNLALKLSATGGIFVGGGIAPKILPKLQEGGFMAGFIHKGRFEHLVRDIPVRVILDDKSALLGAARAAAIRASLL
jgi:glucokinase